MNDNERTICLIRHGKTDQNIKKLIQGRKNFQLSELGKNEATNTAEYLKNNNYHFEIIYVSPLDRAKDTAKIIKSIINYDGEIIVNEAFQERDFGEAEGMSVCPEVFVKVLDDSWKGLEKTKDIMKRVVDGILEIINTTTYKNILIVSHAHAINAFLLYLDNTRKMNSPLVNCSMSFVKYKAGKFELIEVNKLP